MSGLIVDTAMFFLFLSLPSYLLNNIVIITLHCFFYAYVTWFSYFCENEAHLNRKPVHLEMTSLYDSSFEDGFPEQKVYLGTDSLNRKVIWGLLILTESSLGDVFSEHKVPLEMVSMNIKFL